MQVFKALSIAGTDPTGGAGIHADLKTFQELGVFGMTAITAVVAQNTLGVKSYEEMPLELIAQQIDAVMEDIPPDAVKTGMLSSGAVIELVASKVKEYRMPHLVVDPVMVAKSGDALLTTEARDVMRRLLLPLAQVVTPNIPEAETLTGRSIKSMEEMKAAAQVIVETYGAQAAVVKGGHLAGEAVDVLYDGKSFETFYAPRMDTPHTHGTGCTFSAAITAELAKGAELSEAVSTAKAFMTAAIQDSLGIGRGHGPTNHWAYRKFTK